MNSSCYNDVPYIGAVSSFTVPGLFTNFHSAATLLRMARSELKHELIDNGDVVVSSFYHLLDKVETYIMTKHPRSPSTASTKFIIEVEGLDGSGKTTLVNELTQALPNAFATKTPSKSLNEIRPLWDHRGGILARAFYMVSNYVLEYEISNDSDHDIVVIDRWYASTCAYTIARPPKLDDNSIANDEQTPNDIMSNLPGEVYEWPQDLRLKPQLLLVLNIDPEVRRKRVENRALGTGGASRFNPWDDRLAKEVGLGDRILKALNCIMGPNEIHSLNANATIDEVVQQALDIVQPAVQKYFHPQEYFSSNPLAWWVYMGQQLDLCNSAGKRSHHGLWNLQVSYRNNIHSESGPPVLKTVGLDRIDSSCIYYWTADSAFPPEGQLIWASVLWMVGEYPVECQWRGEGFLTRVTVEECKLRGFSPPPSLVTHVTTCCECKSGNEDGNNRLDRPNEYDDLVEFARLHPKPSNVCMVRFVPIRIEVLRGGPGSGPGFPRRFEWSRNANDNDWGVRSILPYSKTLSSIKSAMTFQNTTIAIVGTHAAGKNTIGTALAKLLGFCFHPELGEVLRDQDTLVAGGHLHGNGSSATPNAGEHQDWDDRIFRKECERDQDSSGSRVVETWHVGNFAWYYLRQKQKYGHEAAVDMSRYKNAIAKHQKTNLVLLVQLTLDSSSATVRRREQYSTVRMRLPMQDEEEECLNLYQALQVDNGEFVKDVAESIGLPVLQIDNRKDGREAMNDVLGEILLFVQQNYYRRVVVTS